MSASRPCLVVVVLYRMAAKDSVTVQGLMNALRDSQQLRDACTLLLWDNTPLDDTPASDQGAKPGVDFRYQRATVNDGIAGACNAAMQVCLDEGYEWLLILDQDTVVTAAYLEGMLSHRQAVSEMADVGAIVPVLFDHGFQLSPKQVLRFCDQPISPTRPGILAGEVFAANSGTMLRVSALQAVGGYSRDFWLDHSDMYVFHQLHLQGFRVFFAAGLALQHSMTMLDYDGSMSPWRYENFLSAEQAFFDLYKGPAENAVQVLRLLLRVLRQRRYRNKAYSNMTFHFLLRRLRTSKAGRLASWKGRAVQRQKAAGRGEVAA